MVLQERAAGVAEESSEPEPRRTHCKSNSEPSGTSFSIPQSEVSGTFSASRELWQRRANAQPEPSGRHTPDLVVDLPGKAAEPEVNPDSPDMSTAAERFAKQNQCTLKKNTKKEGKEKDETADCGLASEKLREVKSELELVLNPAAHQQRLKPKLMFEAPSPQSGAASKPQVKAKPQILRKPVLPLPVPPTEVPNEPSRKEAE